MDTPVRMGEARTADGGLVLHGVALRILEGWLACNEVGMSPAEYLTAGREGRLTAALSAPYEALTSAF